MKKVLVIDAQGGGIGSKVIAEIKKRELQVEIIGVGTNSIAMEAMLKSGADHAATGENSAVYCSTDADYIIGPIGIAVANSMYGEITERMAVAVGSSHAKKFFIPVNSCNNYVVGVTGTNLKKLIEEAVDKLTESLNE
ncbi:MAG: DUF3842 family protein [Lachnospiraceae bacterium]|nr:DUF3842 family protein [Lachnospiraceae bacterium]MBR5789617.1 DUF3842 family protein [Lachnospiraceae bacterium]